MSNMHLEVTCSSNVLVESYTYDVALVRMKMVSEVGNVLSYCSEPLCLETSGPIEIIGPKIISLQGGYFGTYVKSKGVGQAQLKITDTKGNETIIDFEIKGE